jgi:hypothetical protein
MSQSVRAIGMPRLTEAGASGRNIPQFTCFETLGSRLPVKTDRRRRSATDNNWTGNSNFRPLSARMWQRNGWRARRVPSGTFSPSSDCASEERLWAGPQPGCPIARPRRRTSTSEGDPRSQPQRPRRLTQKGLSVALVALPLVLVRRGRAADVVRVGELGEVV